MLNVSDLFQPFLCRYYLPYLFGTKNFFSLFTSRCYTDRILLLTDQSRNDEDFLRIFKQFWSSSQQLFFLLLPRLGHSYTIKLKNLQSHSLSEKHAKNMCKGQYIEHVLLKVGRNPYS